MYIVKITKCVIICLPFVTMFTILNIENTGSLSALGFFAHTDTVPALYWGSPLMDTKVIGCATDAELLYSMSVVVVLTVYSISRPASSAGSQDTCSILLARTRTFNDPAIIRI